MRHHHEISLRDSWNYVLNHEAPPWDLTKRFMGLCPKPYHNHVPLTKHRIIMHTKPHAPIQPTIQSYFIRIIMHTNLMSIYITNHPNMFHMCNHTKLVNSNPNISCRSYKASYWNLFKATNHYIMGNIHVSNQPCRSRSGERGPLLKLPALAWARLHSKGTSRSRSGETTLAQVRLLSLRRVTFA